MLCSSLSLINIYVSCWNDFFHEYLFLNAFQTNFQKSIKHWNVRKRCQRIRHEDCIRSDHKYSNHSKFKYGINRIVFCGFLYKILKVLNFRTGKSGNRTFHQCHGHGANNGAKKGFLAWFIKFHNPCYFGCCLRHRSVLRWLHGCK